MDFAFALFLLFYFPHHFQRVVSLGERNKCSNGSFHECTCETTYNNSEMENHDFAAGKIWYKITCYDSISRNTLLKLPLETTHLNITNTYIEIITSHFFQNIPHLEKLTMKNNRIKGLQHNAFEGLLNLVKLDLSFNGIDAIDMKMFSGLPRLQRLNLAGNPFKTIPEGTFDALPSLKWINLPGESLKCDCKLKWIVSWFSLNRIKVPATSTCYSPKALKGKIIRKLKRKELHCNWPLEFHSFTLSPSSDQILFESDSFALRCQVSDNNIASPKLTPEIHLHWLHEGVEVHSNSTIITIGENTSNSTFNLNRSSSSELLINNTKSPISSSFYTIGSELKIAKLKDDEHTGRWSCLVKTSTGNASKSIYVTVISPTTKYCPLNHTRTNKGSFVWPKTLRDTIVELPCPHHLFINKTMRDQSIELNGVGENVKEVSSRKCNVKGHWEQPNTQACQYSSSTTRKLLEISLLDFGKAESSKALQAILDIVINGSLVADIMDLVCITTALEKVVPYLPQQIKLGDLLVEIINHIMDIPQAILTNAHLQENICSRLVGVLEQVTDIMQFQVKHFTYTKNIIVETFVINPTKFHGLTCTAFFDTDNNANDTGISNHAKRINDINLDELYEERTKGNDGSRQNSYNQPYLNKPVSFSGGNAFWCVGTNARTSEISNINFAQASVQITKESILANVNDLSPSRREANFEEIDSDQKIVLHPKSAFSPYFRETAADLQSLNLQSENGSEDGHEESVNLRIIVYKNAKLFPANFKRQPQFDTMHQKGIIPKISSPVVNIKILNSFPTNFTFPITIKLRCLGRTLYDQAMQWNTEANYGYGGWIANGCAITSFGDDLCILSCYSPNNVAVVQDSNLINYRAANNPASGKNDQNNAMHILSKDESPLLSWYMYVGGGIMILCLLFLALSYTVFYWGIQISNTLRHTLVNSWFGLSLLIFVYLTAVKLVAYPVACQLAGIALHYSSLCVLFWLTLISKAIQMGAARGASDYEGCHSVYNKSYDTRNYYAPSRYCKICMGKPSHPNNDNAPLVMSSSNRSSSTLKTIRHSPGCETYDGPYSRNIRRGAKEGVFGFYLIGWGISFIICGITAAISLNNYYAADNGYCFLVWEISLWALYFPATLLLLINLLLLFKAGYHCVKFTLAQHKVVETCKNPNKYVPIKSSECPSLNGDECSCYYQNNLIDPLNCRTLNSGNLSQDQKDEASNRHMSRSNVKQPNHFYKPGTRLAPPINYIKYYDFNYNNNNSSSCDNDKRSVPTSSSKCNNCRLHNSSGNNESSLRHCPKPYNQQNSHIKSGFYVEGTKRKTTINKKVRQNVSSETTYDERIEGKKRNALRNEFYAHKKRPLQKIKNEDHLSRHYKISQKVSLKPQINLPQNGLNLSYSKRGHNDMRFRNNREDISYSGNNHRLHDANLCRDCYNTGPTCEETEEDSRSGWHHETSSKVCSECLKNMTKNPIKFVHNLRNGKDQNSSCISNLRPKNEIPTAATYNHRPNILYNKADELSVLSSKITAGPFDRNLSNAPPSNKPINLIDSEKAIPNMIKFQIITIVSCVVLWQTAGLAVYQKNSFTRTLYLKAGGRDEGIRYELTGDFLAFLLSQRVLSNNLSLMSAYRYPDLKAPNKNRYKTLGENYMAQAKGLSPFLLGYYYDYYYRNLIKGSAVTKSKLYIDFASPNDQNTFTPVIRSSKAQTNALSSYAWTAISIATGLLFLIYHGLSRRDLINAMHKSLNCGETLGGTKPGDIALRQEDPEEINVISSSTTSWSKILSTPDGQAEEHSRYLGNHSLTKYHSLPSQCMGSVTTSKMFTNGKRGKCGWVSSPINQPLKNLPILSALKSDNKSSQSCTAQLSVDEPISLLSASKTIQSNVNASSIKTYPTKGIIKRANNLLWSSWLNDKPASN